MHAVVKEMPVTMLDLETLRPKMAGLSEAYASGEPFPHIVIDDFLPTDLYRRICEEFPGPGAAYWDRYAYQYQTKLACNLVHRLPESLRATLFTLNSGGFLEVLEELTGESGLISDPYYVGGGIHQIERGGKLAIHADFTEPPHYPLYRRLNLLIYLNPEWQPEYGGDFELWDAKGKEQKKKVAPIGNRCVVFTTTATSYHGHPEPLQCPEGTTRRSLALYYYQLEAPAEHAGVITRWNKETRGQGAMATARNRLSRALWWISYKFAGLAGRIDV